MEIAMVSNRNNSLLATDAAGGGDANLLQHRHPRNNNNIHHSLQRQQQQHYYLHRRRAGGHPPSSLLKRIHNNKAAMAIIVSLLLVAALLALLRIIMVGSLFPSAAWQQQQQQQHQQQEQLSFPFHYSENNNKEQQEPPPPSSTPSSLQWNPSLSSASIHQSNNTTIPSFHHHNHHHHHDDEDDDHYHYHYYTQQDIIRLIRQTRARWHVLIVEVQVVVHHNVGDRQPNKSSSSSSVIAVTAMNSSLIRLSKKPNAPAWGNWKEHFVELLIDGYTQGISSSSSTVLAASSAIRSNNVMMQQQEQNNQATATTLSSPSTSTSSLSWTWQVVLDTLRDNVHLPCMPTTTLDNDETMEQDPEQHGTDAAAAAAADTTTTMPNTTYNNSINNNRQRNNKCFQETYPAIAAVGSISKTTHATAPFLYQFPFKQYNQCLFQWRQRQRQQQQQQQQRGSITNDGSGSNSDNNDTPTTPLLCHLQELVLQLDRNRTDDIWDSLHPQIYWRGSSLKFLTDRPDFEHYKTCDEVLPQRSLADRKDNKEDDIPSMFLINETVHLLLQEQERLAPRCLAAVMSLQAQLQQEQLKQDQSTSKNISSGETTSTLPWINVKFTGNNRNHKAYRDKGFGFLLDQHTHPVDMSQYKYQIDFGGIGGTTWLGTITKLAMPGLLFHHETPAKDWFHDEMVPWVHYVPIHTNLSNLYDMFVWAETHRVEAKRMAKRGQAFARHLVSETQFAATFENLYVQQVGAMVKAYQPLAGNESLASILRQYRESGISTALFGTCDAVQCQFPKYKSGNTGSER